VSGGLCLLVGLWAIGMRKKLVPPPAPVTAENKEMLPVGEMDKKEWD
jgi:hypothetical protein